ncbi:MAG: hypothetical protein IKS48_00355 [Eubacterium sp.]|nr:hypothetical protein [Eubacterium sp.]
MPEKCKLYNLESFTDEERQRVEDLINQIEEEKKVQKWWIMPKYSCFDIALYEKYGPCYQVEPQKDSYSRNRPPLKSDFESKESAEKWLKEYLEWEVIFKSAINDIDNLVCNLGNIREHLRKHEYIGKGEWKSCFELFDESLNEGVLHHVTREE